MSNLVSPSSKYKTALLWLFWLTFIVVGYWTVYRAAWNDVERTDYTVYLAAGQAVLDDSDIYKVQNAQGWNYVYPPPFALLLTFFASVPKAVGALVWYLLSVFCIVSGSVMSVKMLGMCLNNKHKTYLLYAVPLLSLASILVGGTMRSQASEFMIALTIAVFYFYFQGRLMWAGVSLAAAILIKVFPVTLLAYFVIRRQWRLLGYTFAGLFVMGILLPSLFWGGQKNIDYIMEWVNIVAGPVLHSNTERANTSDLYIQLLDTQKPRNQSIEALLLSLNMPASLTKFYLLGVASAMFANDGFSVT